MNLIDYKGIGKTRLAQLEGAGIFCDNNLINYFPKKYYDFSACSTFEEDDLSKILLCKILTEPKIVRFKGMNYAICKVMDTAQNIFSCIWYNQPFIKSILIVGETYFLYGKNSPKKKNTFVVSMTKLQSKVETNLLPVYKKIGTLSSQAMSDLIGQALNNCSYESIISASEEEKFDLINLKSAYSFVHKPQSQEDIVKAKTRIDVEKLVPLAMKNLCQTFYGSGKRFHNYENLNSTYENFANLLSFELTDDQKNAIRDCIADLSASKTMNRLLQGEVGSGKTMVAFFCLYAAYISGFQSAIIAPTEILARQHYENLLNVLSGTGIHAVLLTSSLSAVERREILRQIKLGIAHVVVGTHSVIGDAVQFKKLALAVIDEQHRFGVAQRAKLSGKGENIDTLVMSATPIPRSMALAIYGNLNLSVIKNCPFEKNIVSKIVSREKQTDMWQYILQKVNAGSKVFVVCSNIDSDDEKEDFSATTVYEKLRLLFGSDKTCLLHGKLKKEQIAKSMKDFAQGSIKVLVSTTVVEVGVDVPEADIMVIVSPEKFGLATLHQLRGRVGRNGQQSYCFCLTHDLPVSAIERLQYFCSHQSGFDVAEFDYNNRGSGDIFGTQQHGVAVNFSVNLKNYDLAMEIAKDVSQDENKKDKILHLAEQNYAKLCGEIVLN